MLAHCLRLVDSPKHALKQMREMTMFWEKRMNQHTVGVRLLRLRNGRELSLRQLEEQSGINKSTLHKWETDKAIPTRYGLQALAELYNVPAAWLLFGREKESSSTAEGDLLLEQFMVLSEVSKNAVKQLMIALISLEGKREEKKDGA